MARPENCGCQLVKILRAGTHLRETVSHPPRPMSERGHGHLCSGNQRVRHPILLMSKIRLFTLARSTDGASLPLENACDAGYMQTASGAKFRLCPHPLLRA